MHVMHRPCSWMAAGMRGGVYAAPSSVSSLVCAVPALLPQQTTAAAAAPTTRCLYSLSRIPTLSALPLPSHAASARGLSSSSRPPPGRTPKRESTTHMGHFSPRPRRSASDPLGGELAPAAPGSDQGSLTLSAAIRKTMLNPQRVRPGNSQRDAQMDRELHAPNKNRLNHSLAYHIERQDTWAKLVNLMFEHMHHITAHNWVRGCQRLVKLSPSRQLLDVDTYNQFGRLMVQLENALADLDRRGLMRVIFVPYHYLRQCLKQQRMAQEAAVARDKADPEGAKLRRRAKAVEAQAATEAAAQTRAINLRVSAAQEERKDRYSGARPEGDAKSKKLRAKEHRAGRVFTSVAATKRAQGSKGSAFKATGPKRGKPKPAWGR